MLSYDDRLSAVREAWREFCVRVEDLREGRMDMEEVSELQDLWDAYKLARLELGGDY